MYGIGGFFVAALVMTTPRIVSPLMEANPIAVKADLAVINEAPSPLVTSKLRFADQRITVCANMSKDCLIYNGLGYVYMYISGKDSI